MGPINLQRHLYSRWTLSWPQDKCVYKMELYGCLREPLYSLAILNV